MCKCYTWERLLYLLWVITSLLLYLERNLWTLKTWRKRISSKWEAFKTPKCKTAERGAGGGEREGQREKGGRTEGGREEWREVRILFHVCEVSCLRCKYGGPIWAKKSRPWAENCQQKSIEPSTVWKSELLKHQVRCKTNNALKTEELVICCLFPIH